ncbi:MAG: hypothetical protein ACI4F1_11910 [Bariatricus sp.]
MDNELENKVSQEESVLDTQPDLQLEGAGTPAELTEADGNCAAGAEETQVTEEVQVGEEQQMREEAQVTEEAAVTEAQQEGPVLEQPEVKAVIRPEEQPEVKPEEKPVYTDPNAGAVHKQQTAGHYSYGDPNTGYYGNPNAGYHGNAQQTGTMGSQQNGASDSNMNQSQNGQNYNTNSNQAQKINYNQNYNFHPGHQTNEAPLSMGEWLLTLLIGAVPCFGIIIYCIWAFEKNGNVNRRNYCRAYLIMTLIAFAIVMIFVFVAIIGALLRF